MAVSVLNNATKGRVNCVSLTSGQKLLDIALDTNVCPVNSYSFLNPREGDSTGLPTVYGTAVVSKRTSGSPVVWILGDSGIIYMNKRTNDAWEGWKELRLTDNASGTITYSKTLPSGGTMNSSCCYRSNGVVNVSARVYGISETAQGTWFNIPSGFRPRQTSIGIAYMYVNGAYMIVQASIDSSGNVSATLSSAQTTSQVGFVATYPVA